MVKNAIFSYDDSYIFVDKLPSCCRIDPSPPLADCLHDVGNPTDDLEPEDPKLVYHWNDLFYTTGCPWVITERYENYVMALVGLLGFMSFIKVKRSSRHVLSSTSSEFAFSWWSCVVVSISTLH